MLTQSAAGTGWVNERDPTVALGPGNGNQPLNHTPVIENWKEIFTENLYIALSFILWIFQATHCLTLVVVLGSLASLPILPISRNSFSFIRLWSSCHFCFKTNTYSELDFFLVLQLNSIYFPFENSEQNNLPFVLTKTSFRVEQSQTWLPLQQWWSECCLSRDWFGQPI